MYVPKLDKMKFEIIEANKDGYKISLKNSFYKIPIYLNETSRYILDLVNGKNSIEAIERKIQKKYTNVTEAKIKQDLLKAFLLFYNLRIVDWVNKNPYFDKLSYKETDILFYNVHNMDELILHKTDYCSPYKDISVFFNRELLEFQTMNGQIHFFAIKQKNNKIFEVGIAPNIVESTLEIIYMHKMKDISIDIVNHCFDWLANVINTYYLANDIEDCKDTRIVLYTTSKRMPFNCEELSILKFTYAGRLEREFSYGDMDIFIRSISINE